MPTRLQKLRDALLTRHPESKLDPLTPAQMKRLLSRHPKMPAHLRDFFRQVGCGCIGDSCYSIYPPIDPSEIFDRKTAAGLKGVVLVGDDFAGTHDAYDTRGRWWRFGQVGDGGTFQPSNKPKNLVALVSEWFAGPGPGAAPPSRV